jgi:hypothetical protein
MKMPTRTAAHQASNASKSVFAFVRSVRVLRNIAGKELPMKARDKKAEYCSRCFMTPKLASFFNAGRSC